MSHTGKGKHISRKCNHCFSRGKEKQLFTCSRCRSQTYCSKDCQKADWKTHKPMCQNNGLLEARLKEHENTPMGLFDRFLLVDGISMYELDQRLEKWVRYHNSTLMGATIQALRLPVAVARARTHVLYVKLDPRPHTEHDGSPSKFFRVVDAYEVAIADAMQRPAPWPESLAQLSTMADELERGGQGTVAAAMIECPPLAVQTVPFGSMTQRALKKETLYDDWKAFFVDYIEKGTRPKLVKVRN